MWVNKNGIWNEPFIGYPTPSFPAVSDGSSTSFSATSPLSFHSKGDFFQVWAYHTADCDICLRGAYATWVEFEVIFSVQERN